MNENPVFGMVIDIPFSSLHFVDFVPKDTGCFNTLQQLYGFELVDYKSMIFEKYWDNINGVWYYKFDRSVYGTYKGFEMGK